MSSQPPRIRSVRSDGDGPSHGVLIQCKTGAAIYMDVVLRLEGEVNFVHYRVPSIDLDLGRVPVDRLNGMPTQSDPFTCENLSGYRLRTRPLADLTWSEVEGVSDLATEIVECAKEGEELFLEA